MTTIDGWKASTERVGHGNGFAVIRIITILEAGRPASMAPRLMGLRRPPSKIGGFTFAEDSRRDARTALIAFDALFDPSVLVVRARPCWAAAPDFDVSVFGSIAIVLPANSGPERVILSDGISHLRLDVHSGSVADGPVHLEVVVERLRDADLAFAALKRLRASFECKSIVRQPLLDCIRAQRWAKALGAWDARGRGANQRDIAALLFGIDRIQPEWNQKSDSLRSQIRRLLRFAEHMVDGGWRSLLGAAAKPP